MAYQLANYIFCGVPVPNAYFVIIGATIDLQNEIITVNTAIWANGAAYASAQPFITSTGMSYNFSGAGYEAALESTPSAGPDGAVPTAVGDIIITNLYAQLLTHPQASLVLAGATAV